ncbi:unnamed protein product, partial [Nippostrongylus brasiliensis]|uniref:Endo/exonuclease/phosphatase domain-containing protein n=1 Tax=Nippostrongylus brasiliensis TaxID=27835 RepID=A0A0N4YUU1_NIPBR
MPPKTRYDASKHVTMPPKKACDEPPAWLQAILTRFDNMFDLMLKLQDTQVSVLAKLSALEDRVAAAKQEPCPPNAALYSTLVKFQGDSKLVSAKSCGITWVGIGEQVDEPATHAFDREALKEVIDSSADDDLIREFSSGQIVVHRHPKVKNSEWSGYILIMGDLNFPLINWENQTLRGACSSQSSSEFLNFSRTFKLSQLVNQPTHGLNILDILLASPSSIIESVAILPPFSTSDHNIVSFGIRNVEASPKNHPKNHHNYAKGNYDAINHALASVDWVSLINSAIDIESCYQRFVEICENLIAKFIPRYDVREKPQTYPSYIQTLKSRVNYYHSRRNVFGHAKYYAYARKLKRALARLSLREEKKVAECKNSYRFYQFCRQKLQLQDCIPTITGPLGEQIKSDERKAELFADYFESVYKPPSHSEREVDLLTDVSLEWVDISSGTVYGTLRRLPGRNSTSPDGFYQFCRQKLQLQDCIPTITGPLGEQVKSDERKAELFADYFESVYKPPSHSEPLLSTVPLWHREIDRGKFVSVCYIDYKKAFDSISIPLLLTKVKAFGIKGCLL